MPCFGRLLAYSIMLTCCWGIPEYSICMQRPWLPNWVRIWLITRKKNTGIVWYSFWRFFFDKFSNKCCWVLLKRHLTVTRKAGHACSKPLHFLIEYLVLSYASLNYLAGQTFAWLRIIFFSEVKAVASIHAMWCHEGRFYVGIHFKYPL